MNLVPAVWLFAALSALATALSWFLPACRKNYLPAKMTCSSLFLLTALFAAVSYGEVTDYSVYIIVALIFGLIGDFFLEYKQAKYFGYGVVAFAVGHLLYIYSFARLVQPVPKPNAILVAVFTLVILVLGFVMMKVEKIVFEGKNRLMYIYAAILISEFITGVIRGVTSIAAGNTIYGAFIGFVSCAPAFRRAAHPPPRGGRALYIFPRTDLICIKPALSINTEALYNEKIQRFKIRLRCIRSRHRGGAGFPRRHNRFGPLLAG